MKYTIRNAVAKHIEDCAKIVCQEYNSNVLNEGWSQENAFKYCDFYFQLQPNLFFVAEYDDEVVGFIFAYIKPWSKGNCLMFEELCVKEDFRRNGIARDLLHKVIVDAVTIYKIVRIKAETYGMSTEMPFSWYKRLGFDVNREVFLITGNPKVILRQLS